MVNVTEIKMKKPTIMIICKDDKDVRIFGTASEELKKKITEILENDK